MTTVNLDQLFNDQLSLTTAFTPLQILLSLMITFLMALFVHWVYKKTYSGVLYSKNFSITLVMVALVVNAIVIGLSGNLILSLGMVGALSIIRFRTAVKDPKDTAFLFWVIAIGLVNGVSYYILSLVSTFFITVALFFLSKFSSFEPSYVLIISYKESTFKEIEPLLESTFTSFFITSDSSNGNEVERVIEVKLANKKYESALRNIRNIPGVISCVLLASNGEFAE